ncbi:MAG: SDR family oxidoreductase, partial [Armatimonadota bacterium]
EEVTGLKLAVRRAYFEATGRRVSVKHFSSGEIAGFLARPDAKKLLAAAALTPDEFAYANGPPLWLEGGRLKRRIVRDGRPASSFLAPGIGLFVVGTEKIIGLVRDVVVASLSVRAGAAEFGGVNPLTRRQREFIANWEMEGYRKHVAGITEGGELGGRIAVVTGAGSGLGRSIAVGLARAGADVALADLDLASAEKTGALIGKESPNTSCAAVRCDVTSEKQVEQAFARVLDRWGGLDILVNAAGIAPPYPLVDLPLDQWRRALAVNLTGYFLMARAAARIMVQQGMGGSIINVSSKSGLEASKSNTPYNATKAGEMHMARGWALELGEHGIRVNSVAPGNVFEGSKIWNREYIEACAKKHGIEPEEVIPHYVKMTALKREVKGRDVADAVVFLCSDRARTITGQTLVPDSGQVMVR